MSKKISIDPDWLLEWLLDRGYVEKTESAFSPYRIATDTSTDRPYTVTEIVHHLGSLIGKSARSSHNKPLCREVKKCFNEFNISYLSFLDHARLSSELRPTLIKEIEEKTGLDLDPLCSEDRRKLSILAHRYIREFGREEGFKRIRLYAQRRLENLGEDLRKGRLIKGLSSHLEDIEPVENVQCTRDTESLESIMATSGAIFSKLPVSVI